MKFKIILLFSLFLTFSSCDKRRAYDEFQSVGSGWKRNQIIRFRLPKLNPFQGYKLFINIRNNNEYPFNNLFMLVSMEEPDGLIKVDTLEYSMANPDGSLLGEGFTDTKESKLFYKENFKFQKKGVYKISIQQVVRQIGKITGVKELKGVTEVGFRVEKN